MKKCLWKIAGLMEDLFLGSQWSIILGYRRLSVKFFFFILNNFFVFALIGRSWRNYNKDKEIPRKIDLERINA